MRLSGGGWSEARLRLLLIGFLLAVLATAVLFFLGITVAAQLLIFALISMWGMVVAAILAIASLGPGQRRAGK